MWYDILIAELQVCNRLHQGHIGHLAPYPNVSEASLDTPPAQSATSASPPLPSEAAAATLACAAASSRLAAEKSDLSSASIRDLVVSSAERSAQ